MLANGLRVAIWDEVTIVSHAAILEKEVQEFSVAQTACNLEHVHITCVDFDLIGLTWERIYYKGRNLESIDQEESFFGDLSQNASHITDAALEHTLVERLYGVLL